MRRPFHRMQFPLTLAAGLRNMFDYIVSTPLSPLLTDLARRLSADCEKSSDKEPIHRGSPGETEPSRRREH
jgi:hypothetical protein